MNWEEKMRALLREAQSCRSEVEAGDRLAACRAIARCLNVMAVSLNGWFWWLQQADVLTRFNQSELVDIYFELLKLAESLISLDLKVSKLSQKKIREAAFLA